MNKEKYDILYWENWIYGCFFHKISDIEIIYEVKTKSIEYNFKKKDNILALMILFTDLSHITFSTKLLLNDEEIVFTTNEKKFIENNFKFLKNNNKAKIFFIANDDPFKNELNEEYIWFIRLVRTEVFKNEEDEFYIEQEVNRRLLQTRCYSYEELQQIVTNSK